MSVCRPALTVPLMARKVPALIGHLNYQRAELFNKQRRLAGRFALRPIIDLSGFKTRAVIDWLTLGILLERPTQFWWIQTEISRLLGRTPFVVNTLGKERGASVGFDVTFQEPDIPKLLKAVAAIGAKFGLGMEPVVRSIEISVDFRPIVASGLERAKIARVLMNHLLVEPDVTSNLRDRPRTVWGRDEHSVMRLIYDSKHLTGEENKRFLIETDRDRAPFTDGTFELGAKEAEVRWRVMDKIIDRQNVRAGTFIALDAKSKRARIEVTLDRPEVADLGITFLSDLGDLNFSKLQGRYFRFFLPTFSRQAELHQGAKSALCVWRDRQRALKFSKTGSIGLRAMDEAFAEQWTELKRQALRDMHERGLRLQRTDRTGVGSAGSFIAYEDLNERVLTALRNLGKRVAVGFGSKA
ncbi:hypothetical protein E5S70_04905 [Ensifer adhaerens]|nr:hypothetical protein [Ensifer canadensis]